MHFFNLYLFSRIRRRALPFMPTNKQAAFVSYRES
jgi:hypothetical protein